MSKLISDYGHVEIFNKVKDILRMYHSSSWHSEPYHQNQNPSEWCYRTIKAWTNTILNRTGAPANCSLLYMSSVHYILNHISCESLKWQIPLTKLCGVTTDISILMMYTFYESVYYASHIQSLTSSSEEKHAFWVSFGEHVGDAITHKLLDSSSNKVIYRSAVQPADDLHPNECLLKIKGCQWNPTNPNPSHLLNPSNIFTNLSVNPCLNIIQMTSLVEPSFYPLIKRVKDTEHPSNQRSWKYPKSLMRTKILWLTTSTSCWMWVRGDPKPSFLTIKC